MALGGITNTVLHMLPIAQGGEVNFQYSDINLISRNVSHIAKMSPSLSTVHMQYINEAGCVNTVIKEINKRGQETLIDNMTITGEFLFERIADAQIANSNVIRPIDDPYSKSGGLAILYGNLAEEGAVIKSAGLIG